MTRELKRLEVIVPQVMITVMILPMEKGSDHSG